MNKRIRFEQPIGFVEGVAPSFPHLLAEVRRNIFSRLQIRPFEQNTVENHIFD
jgi:hypothetical protein